MWTTEHTRKSLLDPSLETRSDFLVCPVNKYLNSTIHVAYDVKCMNLSIKDTLNKGHLSNEDTVCSPNHIELCVQIYL